MQTGIESVDTLHRSVLSQTSRLKQCADFEVPEIYRSLVVIVERTFAHEQRLMEAFGFPALHCHLEQHARVLAALHKTHPVVMNGNYDAARRVGGFLLPDWLHLHIATQDVTLAIWLAYSQNPVLSEKECNPGADPKRIIHSPYENFIHGQLDQQSKALQPNYREIDPLS
jgi:hemerythrin